MDIRQKAKTLPTNPGCYIMKDNKGEVIYVGKAKNIRKRVSSYWRSLDLKTKALVSNIFDIEYIVTGNEVEALITEAQLIAKHHPKYNIDLKSGQKYAFLKFTSESFPRIIIARKVTKDGKFFGPYPSGAARNAAMKAANNIFKLRTKCKPNQGRPCLRYHLGLCSGSCVGAISAQEYSKSIKDAATFLRGEYTELIKELKEKMNTAAKKQLFEKAKLYRDQISALEKLEIQHVSVPKSFDQDVINYILEDEEMILQVFHFHKGIISGRKEYRFDLEKLHITDPKEALSQFLRQYYNGHDAPKEVVIPVMLEDVGAIEDFLERVSGHSIQITVPKIGTKAKLLEMVKKNLLIQIGQSGGQLYELQQALHLEKIPMIIDCIDISHLGGTDTVASLVQWNNGQSSKEGYRKYIIKGVEGINDFASIEEVVTRFGKRVIEGKEKMPDLLVIDGGKGQLSSATKALKKIGLEMPLIGLAKRLEEIYISWAPYPIQLPQKSPALALLRSLRDEAHRFAITFQRKKRRISSKV